MQVSRERSRDPAGRCGRARSRLPRAPDARQGGMSVNSLWHRGA
jgi:hypothetical protein